MYQALYRKWRPRRFDDVSGQDHVTETLKRPIINGKLSHAYLFMAPAGKAKRPAQNPCQGVNARIPITAPLQRMTLLPGH
jgi:DNA polymerase-3 subunit gamma/tau